MDSLEIQPNAGMKAWRILFGGDQVIGRFKLFVFLGLFLVVGGTAAAFLSR